MRDTIVDVTRDPDSSLVEALAIPAMVGVGALVAIQSEINGRLAGELGTGVRAAAAAACTSFGVGLALLAVVVMSSRTRRRALRHVPAAVRAGVLRPWHLLGGLGGAALVASQGLAVGAIGVALFTVAVVAGQTSSGVLVDRAGLGPSGVQAVSAGRVLGAALTVGAVLLGVAGRLGGDGAPSGVLGLALLPLLAGAATSWQQAVNGRVSMIGGPIVAAFVNFTVGLGALLVLLVVAVLALPGDLVGPPRTWWLYLGGAVGVLFISLSARLVAIHGVLVLGLCTVAGLVVGSVLLDALGPDAHLGPLTVVGALLALAGVGVGSVASARASRATRDRSRPAVDVV